jgi:phage/plasmid-like protein (TIGR03299 family)
MLEMKGTEGQMAYVGEVPWHGLGKNALEYMKPGELLTAEKMRRIAGIDWEVHRAPVFMEIGGKKVKTDYEALYRDSDNKVLTQITKNWHEVKMKEFSDFFEEFVASGDMQMHTAGSLMGGKRVWMLAKANEGFSLFNGKDEVQSHLLFTLPHEYGKVIDIRFTPIRVVCMNTLTLALSGKDDLSVRLNHRRKFNPELVKETLGIARNCLGDYKEMAKFLASRKFKKAQLEDYFATVFPSNSKEAENDNAELVLSRPAKTAMEHMDTQPGHELGAGTWWQPFNAVTYVIDHKLGHGSDTRLTSSWYGGNRKKKINALKAAVEFAEAA